MTYKHEIDDALLVCIITEVLVITSRKTSPNAMVLVHHTRHTVKPESVELKFLHPVTKVAQQKPEDLVRAIVEQPAIPQVMTTFATFMEIEVVGTVELVQTVQDVLARMGVHDIEEDGDTHLMSCVYQLLEIFRYTISRARSKEAGHLIPES